MFLAGLLFNCSIVCEILAVFLCVSCSCCRRACEEDEEDHEERRFGPAEERTSANNLGSPPAALIKHNAAVISRGLFSAVQKEKSVSIVGRV